MEPSSSEKAVPEPRMSEEQYQRRIAYYTRVAERRLKRYGNNFAEFVRTCHVGQETPLADLERLGDERMRRMEATGYNLLCQISDMPLGSERGLIFYGNYVARTHHFGELLATMEREGLITPHQGQVRLGVRAAKALFDPGWPYDPSWGELKPLRRVNEQGDVSEDTVLESVEIVAEFVPRDAAHARDIVTFLNTRAHGLKEQAVPESNEVPDIRATMALADALQPVNFMVQAQANTIRGAGMSQLVVLRQQMSFAFPWQARPIQANGELVSYIAGSGVTP